MELHVRTLADGSPVFWLESVYAERETPKKAGLLWHGGNSCSQHCAACAVELGKVWWTRKPELAARLAEFADAEAARMLGIEGSTTFGEAEIPDVNLRLAMLEALRDLGLVQRPDRVDDDDDHDPEDYDDYDDDPDYQYNSDRCDELLAKPFRAQQLVEIVVLDWDVSNPSVIYDIWPQWDGESEEFDIHDLTGIECCPALKEINIDAFAGKDLSPLRKLPQLKRIFLGSQATIRELRPLLDIATLERVSIATAKPISRTGANAKVIDALLERGVELEFDGKKLAPKPGKRRPAAAPVPGEVSLARLATLDREADKLASHRDHDDAVAIAREALRVREELAADVAAGLYRLWSLLGNAERHDEALDVGIRLAALLSAENRSDEDTQLVLACVAERLAEKKRWADALAMGQSACAAVLRSSAPELTWLGSASKIVIDAARKLKNKQALEDASRWALLAKSPGTTREIARQEQAVTELFVRGCGKPKPKGPLRELWLKALPLAATIGAGSYSEGFYRLFTAELESLDRLVQGYAKADEAVWVVGRNAYGMLWITGAYGVWFGDLMIVPGPHFEGEVPPPCRAEEAFGIRLPAGSLGCFSDSQRYDEWVRKHGTLGADQVLRARAGKLKAVAVEEFYADWPTETAAP
jgi:hypothetical protein